MSLSIHRLFKRTAVAVCLSSLILTAQSPQSAPGASTGAAGEIVGLPPQSTEVTDGGFAPDTGPGPRQVDPFYRVTPGHMQLDTGTTTSLAPTLSRSFQGITDTGWFPPDPIIAAGPSHLVACTNAHVAIYDKANGNRLSLTTALTFFGSLSTGFRLFDPWVVYDRHSSRFFLMFTSTNSGGSNAGRYYIAVSKSSNPTSGWWLYWNDATVNGSTATSNWGDYPRLAVDQNAIYITANMFQFGGSFQYSKVRIMQSKATMLSGGSSQTWWDFWSIKLTGSSTNAFTVQPCHDYDTKTSTAAAYFMACVNGTGSNLYIYGITNVLNRTTGPSFYSTSVGVASYASPGNSTQQGGTTQLENVAPRLMNAVKRNGSMWTCHSTSISGGAAATWYEVPVNSWPTSGSCSLRQQQAFHAGAGYWYAFPSVAVNQNNDMTMVFNRSGTTEYCGCRVTRRLGNAPLNTLEGSTLVKAGEAYYVRLQNGTRNRWGDYAGNSVDPAGDFWFMSEYARPSNLWATWIGSITGRSNSYYIPDSSTASTSCNVIPFGHSSGTNWKRQKYQQMFTAAELGNPDEIDICDLAFVPCVSGVRHFDTIRIRMGTTTSGTLSTTFNSNMANAVTVLNQSNFDWHQTANTWERIGLDRSYKYFRSRGNLVIEITVTGAQLRTSSTAFPGHSTAARQRLFAYDWTTEPTTGTLGSTSALRCEVVMDAADMQTYGVSCIGSNNKYPSLLLNGTGKLGSSYQVQLRDALPNTLTFLSIGLARWTPLNLSIIGAPGCYMYHQDLISLRYTTNSAGNLDVTLPIPLSTEACLRVYFQYFPFDAAANNLKLLSTNYGRLETGF